MYGFVGEGMWESLTAESGSISNYHCLHLATLKHYLSEILHPWLHFLKRLIVRVLVYNHKHMFLLVLTSVYTLFLSLTQCFVWRKSPWQLVSSVNTLTKSITCWLKYASTPRMCSQQLRALWHNGWRILALENISTKPECEEKILPFH